MDIFETIQQITLFSETREKLELFRKICPEGMADRKTVKRMRALLYDEDAALRLECAYWLQAQNAAPGSDALQLLFALQDFDKLRDRNDEQARTCLFNGFTDKNLRLRAKLLKIIHEKDCRDCRERALYFYGRTDYAQLDTIYFECDEQGRAFIKSILKKGVQPNKNVPYHRRQCALALERLLGADALDAPLRELLIAGTKKNNGAPLMIKPEIPRPLNPLQMFLQNLTAAGIWVNGSLLFPTIAIGPATGRVTYRNPGVQTWPAQKRQKEIRPPAGYTILRFDYRTIEPLVLLNILLQKHLLSLADVPPGDIYEAVSATDRKAAKRYLNSLINGGPRMPSFDPGPFLWKLLPALDGLNSELRHGFSARGTVTTIGGRTLAPDKNAANLTGKLMNRLIQGSAADIFNNAVLDVNKWLQNEKLDARVYFLLFDELWLITRPGAASFIAKKTMDILEGQYLKYSFILPLKVRFYEPEL